MAVINICAKLQNGLDISCDAPVRKFFQQAVVINKTDMGTSVKFIPGPSGCAYKVQFSLKPGTTGYRISGPEGGASFFGSFDKSRSDLGFPQYIHNVSILIAGASEEAQCVLDSLDKGSFVVAMQLTTGEVLIYGLENGISSGDYTYDLQGGQGGVPVLLSSLEDAPERYLPFIYESAVPGQEGLDFDDAFAAGS